VTEDEIRRILADHGRLAVDSTRLGVKDDLYEAGLTSHSAVNVMLALEDLYDVEFPEALLQKGTFGSIASIHQALGSLQVDRSA
jgi:acyl carrier protein